MWFASGFVSLSGGRCAQTNMKFEKISAADFQLLPAVLKSHHNYGLASNAGV
jgi:hypothetical protein